MINRRRVCWCVRVIAENDRHRIYINDRMATMQMLSAITADLASISGQHAHQGLLRRKTPTWPFSTVLAAFCHGFDKWPTTMKKWFLCPRRCSP
jgi:DNA repair ATPase RecN